MAASGGEGVPGSNTATSSGGGSGPLAGCVALVTGASRGIGRGIAVGLGEAGATVYVTGRSTEEPPASSAGGGGTVLATAEAVTAAGGRGIALQCDHADDAQVRAAMARIEAEAGGLDVLVNNAFSLTEEVPFFGKFWEQGAPMWDAVCNVGLRSHYVASCLAVPLLQARRRSAGPAATPGLIVNVSSFGGMGYTFNVAYGVGKAGVDRLAADMAVELRAEGVASVSLWPGVVRTERMVKFSKTEEGAKAFDLGQSESPLLSGRVVAALAADAGVMGRTGEVVVVAEAAREYGVVDEDGSQPPSIRSLQFLVPFVMKGLSPPAALIPDVRLPTWLLAKGKASTPSE